LSADAGSVDILGEALVDVPIEVELVDKLLGVLVLLVRFEGVEEGGKGWGGECVPAGLSEGVVGVGGGGA